MMENQPTVSFVLPCYNSHEFLEKTIASIQEQTYRNFEIIIVNDGSTCKKTIKKLSSLNSDIKILNQENKGLPTARNVGFAAATGEYVVPLDCDDWIEPTFVEACLQKLELASNASFVFSSLQLEGDLSGVLNKKYNFFEQLFFNQLPYCIFISKDTWRSIGGYSEQMKDGYEDWEFNIKLGKNNFFGTEIQEPLFHYRVSKRGMLNRLSRKKHVYLWRSIQDSHPDIYNFRALLKIWMQWKSTPMRYSGLLLFLWWLFCRLFPLFISNFVFFKSFHYFSHSSSLASKDI